MTLPEVRAAGAGEEQAPVQAYDIRHRTPVATADSCRPDALFARHIYFVFLVDL